MADVLYEPEGNSEKRRIPGKHRLMVRTTQAEKARRYATLLSGLVREVWNSSCKRFRVPAATWQRRKVA